MASTYSALKIELIGTGDQTGTWGTTTNVNLGDAALGEAITGSADVAFSSADVTVTLVDTNATQTARNLRLNLTGTSGGARNLILGSGCQIEKLYLVNNGLADAVTVKNTTGTGIAVPAGKTMFVYNNGTNVVDAITHLTSLTTGVLSASGATTFTANTASTSTTTGTAVITGGLGVSGRVNAANFDGIVGANTAAAGSFSTLSATGVATFSAGTVALPAITTTGDTNTGIFFPAADTIAFTEGGAESMRIDSSGNVGIGTTIPYGLLNIKGTNGQLVLANGNTLGGMKITATDVNYTANGYLAFEGYSNEYGRFDSTGNFMVNSSAGTKYVELQPDGSIRSVHSNGGGGDSVYSAITGISNGYQISVTVGNAQTYKWHNGGTQSMTLDASGNLGIGTTSPVQKLQVNGAAGNPATSGSTQNGLTRLSNTTDNGVLDIGIKSGGTGAWLQSTDGGASGLANQYPLLLNPVGGNVGIGTASPAVTLHASASVTNSGGIGTEILRVANTRANTGTSGASISFVTNEIESTNQYIRGQITGEYDGSSNVNGRLLFATANTSGTLAERMRITSAGLVGIGTSSPSALLGIATSTMNSQILLGVSTSNSAYGSISLNGSSADNGRLGFTGGGTGDNTLYIDVPSTGQYAFRKGTTTAMTLDANGNVGIGRTPDQRLQIAAPTAVEFDMFVGTTRTLTLYADATQTIIGNPTAVPMIFRTSDTERMRIDSSGNLLVGTTSGYTGKLRVDNASSDGIGVQLTGSGGGAFIANIANTNQNFAYWVYNGSAVGSINTNGSATAYNTSSDYRLKENIAPMTGALATVAQLKPVTYKWKSDGSDGQGFIAHELAEVVPDCVSGEKDAIDTDGNPKYQGVDTSFLVATLTAAIQELKAEFDAYKATHP